MSNFKRVVITGMATINPLGDSLDGFYNNLLAGKSGIKNWSSIDVSNVACKIGGDLGDYDFLNALTKYQDMLQDRFKKIRKLVKKMTFSNKSGVLTSIAAFNHAGLFSHDLDPFRTSVMVAGHNFNTKYVFEQIHQFDEEPEWIDPLFGVESLDPNIPGTLSEVLGVQGPAYNMGAACASGNIALRAGFRDILLGDQDISVVCGPFWDMNEFDIHAMAFLGALVVKPEYQNNPEAGSRPFDKARCGFVPSHGAATIILEELEHAKKRGAKIYAEVLGVDANSNANHLPEPSMEAQAELMKTIMKKCDIKPEQVDFISAHATGTPLGDIHELNAIKSAFGKHAYNLKINAPKSMLGHTTWAAALVETVAAIMQMNNNKLHGATNIDNPADEVDLDVCMNGNVEKEINIFLKNSFGFGGLNCCSLIKKYEG